jgi:hypothetical protein
MAYDAMGNYIGGYDDTNYSAPIEPVQPAGYETEEERRKRLEREAQARANEVAHKQEVTTYADGSKTEKTVREIPAQTSAVPTPQIQTRTMPISPEQDYNARIAQQESGANPNIGYHDRNKGSAYGTYGMTAAGYEDARKLNPNLPADITQTTPEQQTQAQNAYTQQNAKYLQNYGVEPTQNNLAAAHFLGAKGLSDYLKTGYISPQAAAANGGAENVKRIVEQRLGGQAAPASGATQQPVAPQAQQTQPAQVVEPVAPVSPEAPQTQAPQNMYSLAKPEAQPTNSTAYIDQYQTAQNDPAALMKMGTDENVPEWMRERSRNRAADLITQQRDQTKAQADLATKSPSDLARMMTERKKDGSWGKYILFGALGMTALRDEEAGKLGIGHDQVVTGTDGKSYLVKIGANGTPLEGFNSEGKALSPEELIGAVGQGIAQKGATTHTGKMQDVTTGEVYYERTTPQGIQLVDNNGKIYKGSSSNLRPFGIGSDIATQDLLQRQKLQNQLKYEPAIAAATKGASYLAEFNAKNGTNFAIAGRDAQGMPLLVDQTTNQIVQGPAVATGVAPQTAATQVTAPIAAQGATKVQPVSPNAPRPVAGATPAAIEQARKNQEAEEAVIRQVGEAEQKKFIESKQAIGESSQGGQAIGNARRQQLDLIKQNPSILNIMNGEGTQFDQARNIITRIATGAYNDDNKEALYLDIKNSGMGQAEQAALRDFANLNTGINAKTLKANSGAGSISNAEQQANKDANIGNIDRIPAYAALSGLHRSQFSGDLAASKQAFLDAHPEFKTDAQFNSAWQKEEAKLLNAYRGIAKARFDVMGKPPEANASKEALAAYKDRIFKAFEAYPAPQWDANTGKWNYQTANAQRAAALAILGR